MPAVHVTKSININASVDDIYNVLTDFDQWRAWSPWLIMDPEATLTVADDKRSYSWEGKRVGSGNMSLLSEGNNTCIDYKLNFITPWKSTADVQFILEPSENDVKVSWVMNSKLPFFMFWMKKMMIAYIGMDYERGLRMLKEIIEDKEIKSTLDFKGVSKLPATKYIGVKTTCHQDDMPSSMEAAFKSLEAFLADSPDLTNGDQFSIYHKWGMVKREVTYTSGIPVKAIPAHLPSHFVKGEMPDINVYTLRHVGAYEHLGNAWSTLYNMQRSKEIKCAKGIHPFEVYRNDPAEVESKSLITDVNFPLKT
jgi:effector-binding domain-containing protein